MAPRSSHRHREWRATLLCIALAGALTGGVAAQSAETTEVVVEGFASWESMTISR